MIEIHDKPATGATIRLHAADNVVVARTDLGIGARLKDQSSKWCIWHIAQHEHEQVQ